MTDFDWKKEGVAEHAAEMYKNGSSASEIARSLVQPDGSSPSRNAVIGKLHRLGVINPGRAVAHKTVAVLRSRIINGSFIAKPKPAPKAAAGPPIVPEAVVLRPETLSATCTIETIGRHGCRWPVGDPQDAAFGFCGRQIGGVGSYCADHAALAFAPSKGSAHDLERSLRRYV
jgi:GcrA cell cycle regulator